MFRTRIRTETPSLHGRGTVGSARVWDELMRSRGGRPAPETSVAHVPLAHAGVLAADELTAMVAGIVQVTLDTQLADCDPARRAGIARVLEVRLLSLLGLSVVAAPAAPPEVAVPAAEPEAAEPDLPDAAADVAAEPAVESEPDILYPPAQRAIGLVLEDRLERLGGPLSERADLRRHLVALALGFLPAERPVNGNGSKATPDELADLDLLQRRAIKLEQALREARAALAYVSGLEHVDPGLASIYRVVQGLSLEDPLRAKKEGALEQLFQANVALQKRK